MGSSVTEGSACWHGVSWLMKEKKTKNKKHTTFCSWKPEGNEKQKNNKKKRSLHLSTSPPLHLSTSPPLRKPDGRKEAEALQTALAPQVPCAFYHGDLDPMARHKARLQRERSFRRLEETVLDAWKPKALDANQLGERGSKVGSSIG